MSRLFILCSLVMALVCAQSLADSVEGRVLSLDPEARLLELELTKSKNQDLKVGETVAFKVGLGDAAIGYVGRMIQGNAANYAKRWNLEQVFPIDGEGAKAVKDANKKLRAETAAMSRRKFVRQGDLIPNFGMLDQNGDFVQIRQYRGKAFVLNFIFTRCQVPTMCPASTTRMSELQDIAREAGLENLDFVTITFDPLFDSPGVLRQYAKGYGLEGDNFHLLTNTDEKVIEDLLRQFGIMTIEEDGTINHTMATLLVDATGRVAYRKEGSNWTVKEFMKAAKKL